MNIIVKIKGILAMADVTYGELGQLCDVSRAMIHNYLTGNPDIEDCDKGLTVIDCVQKLNKLVQDGKAPISLEIPKSERVNVLKSLLDEVAA